MRGIWFICLILSYSAGRSQISDFADADFEKADSIAALYKGESLESLPLLAHNLTAPLSGEAERFRAIYTWVCTNIENDYGAFQQNIRNHKKYQNDREGFQRWNNIFSKKVFHKLLKYKKTVCTGYAYLIKELANLADINCEIIDGYGRTSKANIETLSIPNHSWNAVKLSNKWYLCDATWSSGTFMIPAYQYLHEYNEGYFLAEPELFATNHYPLDTTWLLMKKKPEISDFLEGPLVYKYAFNHHIQPISPATLQVNAAKNEPLTFSFKAPDSTNTKQINLEIIIGRNSSSFTPEVNRNKDGFFEFNFTFRNAGKYDVHIRYDKDYLVTYTVRVRNGN